MTTKVLGALRGGRLLLAGLGAVLLLNGGCAPGTPEASPSAAPDAHAAPGHADHDDHASDEVGHDPHEHEHEAGAVVIPADRQRAAGVHVVPVARRLVSSILETTGEIAENTDAEAHVTARVAGRVMRVSRTVGDRVRAGETLAVIESDALGDAQAEFLEAQARHGLAKSTVTRQRTLQRGDLTARKEVVAAETDLRVAEIALERARNRLRIFGVDAGRVARLAATRAVDARVPMTAPIGGLVVARNVTLGEMIEPHEDRPAFTIMDPATLWVNANLYERDLSRVRPGQAATVTTPAYPGKVFSGRVSLISTMLDKDTRTARARVAVANPDGTLKPGMFANVKLAVGTANALVVPVSAVIYERAETFVFVQEGPDRFERRKVELDPPTAGVHRVRAGVAEGDQVVAAGAFMLKSEFLKESFGGHAH